jgi:TorA maturation chaperone TorD
MDQDEAGGRTGVLDALVGYHRLLASKAEPKRLVSVSHDLARVLSSTGAVQAEEELSRLRPQDFTEDELAAAWTNLFVRGAVPPYETSNMAPSMVGHLSELADIAGFYKAFGLEVQGERPDHLFPQLEFLTFVSFKYLEAIRSSNSEGADACADALATFLEEHLGSWIGTFAKKVATDLPDNPYEPAISSLAAFVDWLCVMTGLEPRPITAAGPGLPAGFLQGDDAELPGCLGCELPGDRELHIPG